MGTTPQISRMVVKSGGNWKRPVNRMYAYNFQIGENYYLPMTSYLETKNNPGPSNDLPGPLCFSENRCPSPQWHKCQRIRRPVSGDNQEDKTSYHHHVTTFLLSRYSLSTTPSSEVTSSSKQAVTPQ